MIELFLYLMSGKLSRSQVISSIIRGFMDILIMGLQKSLAEDVNQMVDLVALACSRASFKAIYGKGVLAGI